MIVKIKYKNDDTKRVEKISVGNWVDLSAEERVTMMKGEHRLIPLGVAMELPKGFEAHIVPRSSTFKNFKVIQVNSPGIVDNSYSGDNDWWLFSAYALEDTVIEKGSRICQFRIVESQPEIVFYEVELLGNKDRNGFGSTGV